MYLFQEQLTLFIKYKYLNFIEKYIGLIIHKNTYIYIYIYIYYHKNIFKINTIKTKILILCISNFNLKN
ncbi:hypothetical protein K6L59_03675, partial [Candidatus Phytoplasma sp. Tabriz.2]|nr:hypothetical protein [Candidatus Phytoplasma australiense]